MFSSFKLQQNHNKKRNNFTAITLQTRTFLAGQLKKNKKKQILTLEKTHFW